MLSLFSAVHRSLLVLTRISLFRAFCIYRTKRNTVTVNYFIFTGSGIIVVSVGQSYDIPCTAYAPSDCSVPTWIINGTQYFSRTLPKHFRVNGSSLIVHASHELGNNTEVSCEYASFLLEYIAIVRRKIYITCESRSTVIKLILNSELHPINKMLRKLEKELERYCVSTSVTT